MSEVRAWFSAVGKRVSMLYGKSDTVCNGDSSGWDYYGRRVCNDIGLSVWFSVRQQDGGRLLQVHGLH